MTVNELIAENEGSFYIFDPETAAARIKLLRTLLGGDVGITYAVKANPFIAGGLCPYADSFEICSPGEALICDESGIRPKKTVISGVYKTPGFIEKLIKEGGDRLYTVESLNQFELLNSLAGKYSADIRILLRLTNGSQFGINAADIERLVSEREKYARLSFAGIQFFSGTQKTSLKKLRREIASLDSLLIRLRDEYGYDTPLLEYGPGFPVAYFEGEEFDETSFVTGFAEILREMSFKTKITLELGRSIAASCGSYYTKIVDMKRNDGQNYLIVDGGMHHLVYFGQFMGMKHPVLSVCGKEELAEDKSWNICGSLCSMNDILAKDVALPPVSTGDTLRFENAGAYCMTEGISLFLSRDLPAVYMPVSDGDYVCVRPITQMSDFNGPQVFIIRT